MEGKSNGLEEAEVADLPEAPENLGGDEEDTAKIEEGEPERGEDARWEEEDEENDERRRKMGIVMGISPRMERRMKENTRRID